MGGYVVLQKNVPRATPGKIFFVVVHRHEALRNNYPVNLTRPASPASPKYVLLFRCEVNEDAVVCLL